MTKLHKIDYESPIGVLVIIGTNEAVHSILFSEENKRVNELQKDTPQVVIDCYHQLDEYFNGTRCEFTFPYKLEGTAFQQAVWNALTRIPYAETASYKDIAVSIGKERAVRAVGSANGKNQLSIVLPCHRVIGLNGKLTGYAGGLWRKEWLLQHERNVQESSSRDEVNS